MMVPLLFASDEIDEIELPEPLSPLLIYPRPLIGNLHLKRYDFCVRHYNLKKIAILQFYAMENMTLDEVKYLACRNVEWLWSYAVREDF